MTHRVDRCRLAAGSDLTRAYSGPIVRSMKLALREKRDEKSVSRTELVDTSGVSRETIKRIELNAAYEPGVFTAKRLANALGVGVDDLIHEDQGSALPTGRGKNTGTRSAAGKRSPGPDSRKGE